MLESLYWLVYREIKPILTIAIPTYLIFCIINKILIKNNKYKTVRWHIINFSFISYIITVLLLTGMFSINLMNLGGIKMAPNLMPLIQTLKDFSYYPFSVAKQVSSNIMFFIPFGLFLSCFYIKKANIKKISIIALIFSLSIEMLQYFSGRYFDIDDVIWNTLGALIGLLVFYLTKLLFNNKNNKFIEQENIN